jgi:hypothetical protein
MVDFETRLVMCSGRNEILNMDGYGLTSGLKEDLVSRDWLRIFPLPLRTPPKCSSAVPVHFAVIITRCHVQL